MDLDTKIALAKAREGVFIAAEKQDTLSDLSLDDILEVTKDVTHQQDTSSDLGLDNLFILDVTRDSAAGKPGEVHGAPKTDVTGAICQLSLQLWACHISPRKLTFRTALVIYLQRKLGRSSMT